MTFTHFNAHGEAVMVDVGDKTPSKRQARASGKIHMAAETLALIAQGGHKKGDVLGIARIAGIQAAKRTFELIPLCHLLQLTKVEINFHLDAAHNLLQVESLVETFGVTGVEIEALQAVQTALLTVYDMCKAVDRGMVMQDIGLLYKAGGQSGVWQRSVVAGSTEQTP
jgi:cyclic pyranopterin phosphate synthase